jgi:ParB-like nuclease domain
MLTVEASTFDRARRKRLYRRVVARLGLAAHVGELLALDVVTGRQRLSGQSHLGLRTIPVRAIIGTMDRAGDFDGEFLPRRADMAERWHRVERIVQRGQAPPIVVHELDGRYFVVDGHHRVAIARQHGIDHLEAEVTRIRTRAPLTAA